MIDVFAEERRPGGYCALELAYSNGQYLLANMLTRAPSVTCSQLRQELVLPEQHTRNFHGTPPKIPNHLRRSMLCRHPSSDYHTAAKPSLLRFDSSCYSARFNKGPMCSPRNIFKFPSASNCVGGCFGSELGLQGIYTSLSHPMRRATTVSDITRGTLRSSQNRHLSEHFFD